MLTKFGFAAPTSAIHAFMQMPVPVLHACTPETIGKLALPPQQQQLVGSQRPVLAQHTYSKAEPRYSKDMLWRIQTSENIEQCSTLLPVVHVLYEISKWPIYTCTKYFLEIFSSIVYAYARWRMHHTEWVKHYLLLYL